MPSSQEYRLYAFVANHYLSPLQCGLQTAHVVSEMFHESVPLQRDALEQWAGEDKTIIICGAGNHKGVVDCWSEIERINSALPTMLPGAIFREDEQSMNGMATACGVIVPKKYWDVKFVEGDDERPSYWEHAYNYGQLDLPFHKRYPVTQAEGQFCSHIKQYRLA